MFKITIYGQAPSVNSLYRIGKDGNLYLTRRGRSYKAAVSELFQSLEIKLPPDLRNKPLKVTFKFYFRNLWDGKAPVRRDYDGPIKIVQDAIAEALRFDDSWIFRGETEKRQGTRERAVITLEVFTPGPDEDD